MSSSNRTTQLPAKTDEILSVMPQPLRLVASAFMAWAEADGRLGLAIHGSAIKGGLDEFSDLDFTVHRGSQVSAQEVGKCFETLVGSLGVPLARFFADHLGNSSTQILYFAVDEWVVKLDVAFVESGSHYRLPTESQVLLDPERLLAGMPRRAEEKVESQLLFEKLCGWMWFTYSRIERGELFAAARSIDFSRENALLPIILARLGLPQEGHRRIESRLPPEVLTALHGTYPTQLRRGDLYQALKQLFELVRDELVQSNVTKKDSLLTAALQMWRRIEASEHAYRGRSVGERQVSESV